MGDFFYDHPIVGFLGLIVALVLGLTGIGTGVYALTDQPSCYQTYRMMGLSPKWGFWTGCMIEQPDGTYMPSQLYIVSHISDQHTVTLKQGDQHGGH